MTNMEIMYRSSNILMVISILLIILKFIGLISWSWWWVLSPIWIFLGIYSLIFLCALLIVRHMEKKIDDMVRHDLTHNEVTKSSEQQ
jgi:ABC-type bacteriocin/lantibiotic exporter with double-glycine peptidase domain